MNYQRDFFPVKNTLSYKIERVDSGLKRTVSAGKFVHSNLLPFDEIDDDLLELDPFHTCTIQELRQKRKPRNFEEPMRKSYSVVDLFCGSGGFSLGIRKLLSHRHDGRF